MDRIRYQFTRIIQRFMLVGVSAFLVAASSPVYVLADTTTDPTTTDPTTTTQQTTTDPSTPTTATDPTTTTDTTSPTPIDTTTTQDTTAPTTTDPTPPPPSCPVVVGINQPTGASDWTYHLNTATCLWENDYYTWDPQTKLYTPKIPYVYTYDASTGLWDSQAWNYNAAKGVYEQVPFSVVQPPAGAQTIGGPKSLSVTNTGSGSGNTINGTGTNGITIVNGNKFGIINNIGSTALTGDALVAANTWGGNAISGNAAAMANILNLLQSTSSLGNATTFVANVNGDVQGDLLIDPSLLQPAGGSGSLNQTNNIDVNNHTDGTITNNIDLSATSGNATVDTNTTAGDATSGNATAVANVVNMINSMIASHQSFLGVININGNFNGNILMPAQFLDALIASNAPRATVSIDQNNTTNTNVANTTNETINNQIQATAKSGNATVDSNTTAGNATSGKASTNVTIFDLTGDDIDASNTLLVFVNVLGNWVGLLMNAPAGTTAAAFGGNITRNVTTNANITNTTNETINNNINVNAQTGDASVTKNTTAGNAKSGDAKAAVNLANIMNDHINLSGWFGVLFINVWGNWNGNFGVANPLALAGAGANSGPASSSGGTPGTSAVPQVFQFKAPLNPLSTATGTTVSTSAPNIALTSKVVLGTSVAKPKIQHSVVNAQTARLVPKVVTVLIVALGVLLLGLERYLTYRSSRS